MNTTLRPRRRVDPFRKHLTGVYQRLTLLHQLPDRTSDESREMFTLWLQWAHWQPSRRIYPPRSSGDPVPIPDFE